MLDVRVRMYLYRWKARGTEDTVDSSCEVYHMHVRHMHGGPASPRSRSNQEPRAQ